ncbi:hypothetical protein VNO77_39877 [Canavalia gladiata]|uniref:ZF-HD dimerization-type domain-containing protein n=1 Tax=Canavalia gladiata TaxID=3824 RepID=A0AAN9JZD9_CANGL
MDLTPTNNTQITDTNTQTPAATTNNKDSNSKSSSFTNGSLKRHHHHPTTVPPPSLPPSTVVSYKECLKNHAASLGGHALDGCGEFMPSSSSNPTEPRSLTCAACGCHRNFHRRDTQELLYSNPNFISFYQSQPHRGPSLSTSPSPGPSLSPISSPSPPPISHHFPPSYHHHHHHHQSSAPHMRLSLGNEHHQRSLNFSSYMTEKKKKKRYRTKFSQEQKEKMQSFSEKLGWRMQKGDEGLVQDFCNEIGVSRGVFKVWMHNNKNSFRKRSSEEAGDEKMNNANGASADHTNDHSNDNNPYNINTSNNDIHRN